MNNADALKIGFIKRAQELNIPKEELAVFVKKADNEFFKNLTSQLGGYADQAKNFAGGLANQAGDFMKNIDPNNPADSWKTALIGGLGGAAAGGLGTAIGNIGQNEEDQGSVLSNALKGLLAGGAIGGAVPTAKNYLDGFKPKQQTAPNIVNNIQQAPQLPQQPSRENLSADILGGNAPSPTTGNLSNLAYSTMPFGPAMHGQGGSGYGLGGAALGGGIGALGIRALGKGSPKARIIGALAGLFGGNMFGQSKYRGEQANKFTDAARNFTPESLLDNKNISTPARMQMQDSLEGGDPSKILDAIRSISGVAPQKEIPEQFSMVQDMANKEELPGWYQSQSTLQNIGNIFRKK